MTDRPEQHPSAPSNRTPPGLPAPGLPALVGVAVGNTRARVAHFLSGTLTDPASYPNSDPSALLAAVAEAARAAGPDAPIVLASVNPPVADALRASLSATALAPRVYTLGRDLPVQVPHLLDDSGAKTVGQDRLLNALGAFTRTGQAAAIVDAGTAITVDFVDGEGTFVGGVIAPGIRMMLSALHTGTAQLPPLDFVMPPADRTAGANTADAMRLGVLLAARGLVRQAVERFAESYGAFPPVIATGGDMAIFEGDEFVEHFVPDLQLLGLYAACAKALNPDDDAD
jgi:type III pantothenate kinase